MSKDGGANSKVAAALAQGAALVIVPTSGPVLLGVH